MCNIFFYYFKLIDYNIFTLIFSGVIFSEVIFSASKIPELIFPTIIPNVLLYNNWLRKCQNLKI